MGSLLQFGCALIAFCPATMFYLFRDRPQLYIIALAAAFAWLLSMLITGMVWSLIHVGGDNVWPVTLILGVLIQEGSRFGFIYCFRKTERIIKTSSNYSDEMLPLTDISSSLASGIGFGTMHSMMMVRNNSNSMIVYSCIRLISFILSYI